LFIHYTLVSASKIIDPFSRLSSHHFCTAYFYVKVLNLAIYRCQEKNQDIKNPLVGYIKLLL